jgi:hypothetical protein
MALLECGIDIVPGAGVGAAQVFLRETASR